MRVCVCVLQEKAFTCFGFFVVKNVYKQDCIRAATTKCLIARSECVSAHLEQHEQNGLNSDFVDKNDITTIEKCFEKK